MKVVVSGRRSVVRFGGRLCCLLLSAFCFLACSVPNLEPTDCTQARDIVREFYSFHFGNDMHSTVENVQRREKFLTPELTSQLLLDVMQGRLSGKDYFTDTEDFPKAFRVGECKVVEPGNRVQFRVLVFWKDDERTEQKPLFVYVEKENDNWLIDSISSLEK